MIYHQDFRDLCSLLNENKVDYLIVGAFAVAFHGAPRFTGDLDVLVCPETEHSSELMTSITGVSWANAWTSCESGSCGDVAVFFIGLGALVDNKIAAGRPKDLADVQALRRKTVP